MLLWKDLLYNCLKMNDLNQYKTVYCHRYDIYLNVLIVNLYA